MFFISRWLIERKCAISEILDLRSRFIIDRRQIAPDWPHWDAEFWLRRDPDSGLYQTPPAPRGTMEGSFVSEDLSLTLPARYGGGRESDQLSVSSSSSVGGPSPRDRRCLPNDSNAAGIYLPMAPLSSSLHSPASNNKVSVRVAINSNYHRARRQIRYTRICVRWELKRTRSLACSLSNAENLSFRECSRTRRGKFAALKRCSFFFSTADTTQETTEAKSLGIADASANADVYISWQSGRTEQLRVFVFGAQRRAESHRSRAAAETARSAATCHQKRGSVRGDEVAAGRNRRETRIQRGTGSHNVHLREPASENAESAKKIT